MERDERRVSVLLEEAYKGAFGNRERQILTGFPATDFVLGGWRRAFFTLRHCHGGYVLSPPLMRTITITDDHSTFSHEGFLKQTIPTLKCLFLNFICRVMFCRAL